jgi:uncharacterized protein (DUF1501 family)
LSLTKDEGNFEPVPLLTFSEFGRRGVENANSGTDHGAAARMFVLRGRVKPGLFGKYPSLTELDNGDLKFNTDFRGVSGTVLDRWLGAPSATVLGEGSRPCRSSNRRKTSADTGRTARLPHSPLIRCFQK